jgi:hypothetical protein
MFKRVSIILIKSIHARTMISYTLFPIPSIIYISPIHTSQHPNYSLPSFPASTPRRRPSRTRQRKHTIRPANRRLRATHGRRRRRRGRSGRNITPVMRHVRFDQMTSTQCAVEGKFTGEYASGDDASKLACVVAWGGGVCAADAEEVQHCGLGFEDGAAADGADFDGGHRDGDLEVAVYAGGD